MSDDNLVKIPREALLDLISVARSVNRGRQHEVRLPGEDEPCYWQTKEWVDWAIGAGELAAEELKRLNPEPLPASEPAPEQENVMDGWTEFSHKGKRWAFDSDQLALYDHYHSFHGLTDPTEESVIAYIESLKK